MAGATQKSKRSTKTPAAIKQAPTLALGGTPIDSTFIGKGADGTGMAMSDADLQEYSQQLSDVLSGLGTGAGGFTFDSPLGGVGGGGSSPAWSMSSGSNHGLDSSGSSSRASEALAVSGPGWASQELMFPSTVDNTVAAVSNTAADAMLDGWLQQFVNTDAMDANSKSRAVSVDAIMPSFSGAAAFGGSPLAMMPVQQNGGSPLPLSLVPAGSAVTNPLSFSPVESSMDIFDQSTVAAIANASPDMLVSMLSSAAALCGATSTSISVGETSVPAMDTITTSGGLGAEVPILASTAAAGPELSMLASLPFTSLITPMANIAPQKTLSTAEYPNTSSTTGAASPPLPSPAKKQRRLTASPKASGITETARAVGSSTPVTAVASLGGSNALSPRRGSENVRPRPLAPSPPRTTTATIPTARSVSVSSNSSNASNASQQQQRPIAPLAPRQQSPAAAVQPRVQSAAANGQARSGSNTPPGLSVLAKMAQKQVPMQVESDHGLRPIAQARKPSIAPVSSSSPAVPAVVAKPAGNGGSGDPAAQKRQERLIKNRAAALLSRKRKREYLTKLESEVEELRESNTSLVKRLAEMEQRLNALAAERDQLKRTTTTTTNAAAASSSSVSDASTTTSSTTTTTGGQKTNQNAGQSAGPASSNQSSSSSKASDAMQVDEEFVGGGSSLSSIATAPVLPASLQPGASLSQNSLHQAKTAAASVNAVPRNIRPRVSLPVSAPKVQQQQTGTELSVQPGVAKPRAVGAVLMAMLFSFSLFTLPSLYTSDGSLTAGGSQSAGILPAAESRLLISSGVLAKQHNESDATASSSSGGGEPPLIERVRRTISAMTQQQQPQPQPQPQVNSSNSSSSPSQKEEEEIRANKMRPMTMEESAGLHAWIKRGLATGAVSQPGGSGGALNAEALVGSPHKSSASSSLSVVPQRSIESPKPLDYAMMFCQNVQHVLFSGDTGPSALRGFEAQEEYRPASARVLRKSTNPAATTREVAEHGIVQHYGDGGVLAQDNALRLEGSGKDLAPTLAAVNSLPGSKQQRPRMSFYSPVVAVDEGLNDSVILPPWEEYAKMAEGPVVDGSGKQKYLRIDVEVVGSRWVTADKFANGLF